MVGRILALACIAALAIGCTDAAQPTPSPASSQPAAASAEPTATAEIVPTAVPTAGQPTEAPATEGPTAPPGSPAGTPKPQVDSLKAPRTASCTSTNGTDTVGYIRLSWTASVTSGVRLSIDPPSPATAYDYPYADYAATGSADVPFACDPPNHDANGDYHLYVVTTIHESGYYAYRYARVYQAN